jgi:hypothetical protein
MSYPDFGFPFSLKNLCKSYASLSESYRKGGPSKDIKSQKEAIAYALARMPATYAALSRVLYDLQTLSDLSIESVLDWGSGPGTTFWALKNYFPQASVTLVEQNPFILGVLHQLIKNETHPPQVIPQDILKSTPEKSDLMVISYVLSEIPENKRKTLLEKAWASTTKAFVIVEPGTPKGFQEIVKARSLLMDQGAHILAPCGHNAPCPLENTADWCHFPVRVLRTPTHQALKQGKLSYEDEKFSYIVVLKEPCKVLYPRILKKPLKKPGHMKIELCTPQGKEQKTFTKSKNPNYKDLLDLKWGDLLK